MEVRFTLSIGLVGCKKERTIDVKDLGYTEEEWAELSEDEKYDEAESWAMNHVEVSFEEIEEAE